MRTIANHDVKIFTENIEPTAMEQITGRIMSRTQAYNQITMDEFQQSMSGIYSETVNDYTRDESPMVYKPAEEIMRNIAPTVEVERIIKPVFNFKASK